MASNALKNGGSARKRVVIVSLAREKGMGERRRVASLRAIFELAGAESFELHLMKDYRRRGIGWAKVPLASIARGTAVPEAVAWSAGPTLAALIALHPDVVVVETIRAYHPLLATGPWRLVIDFIDRLSVSYADRARVVQGFARPIMFRSLSWTSARFETRSKGLGHVLIAAGRADSADLGAIWIPITQELVDRRRRGRSHDLLFFGNLSYPPNVAAVARLGRLWPELVRRRPGTSLLLAGARVLPEQRAMAQTIGWTIQSDFESLTDLLSRVHLAVVPLEHASGIQIKVLESAAAGLAQVISRAASNGFDSAFPVAVATTDEEFVALTLRLLNDESARHELGAAAREHIAEHYSVAAWGPWATAILGDSAFK